MSHQPPTATGSTPTTTSSTSPENGGLSTPARPIPPGHGTAGGTPITLQQLFATVRTGDGQQVVPLPQQQALPLSEQQDPHSAATAAASETGPWDRNAANADLVPDEEEEDHRHHQPKTPRNTRSTHKSRSPVKDKPQDQHKATSSRGKSSKEREHERNKLVSIYQAEIDDGCRVIRQAIDAAPVVPVGRNASLSVEENLYNNELAYQLWGSHHDRILGLKEELNYHVNLWDDLVKSQTAVFVRESEGSTKAAFLAKRGGYSELVEEFDEHLREVDTAKAQASTALGYYKGVQANGPAASPTETDDSHADQRQQDLPFTTTSACAATFTVSTASALMPTAFTVTTAAAGTSGLTTQTGPVASAAANSDQPFTFGFSLGANARTRVPTTSSTSQPAQNAFGTSTLFSANRNQNSGWGQSIFSTRSTEEEDDFVIPLGPGTTVRKPATSSRLTSSTNQVSGKTSQPHVQFSGITQVFGGNTPSPPVFSAPVPPHQAQQPPTQPPSQPPVQPPQQTPAQPQPTAAKPLELADVVNLFQAGQASLAQSMMQMQAQALAQVQTAMAQQQATQQQAMMQQQAAQQQAMMQQQVTLQQAMMQEQVKLIGTMLQNVLPTGHQQPQAQPGAHAQQAPPSTPAQQAPPSAQAPQAQPSATAGRTQAPLMQNLAAAAAQQGTGTWSGYRSILRDADADFNCGDSPRAPLVRPPEPMPFKGEIHDWPRFDEEWKYYCSQVLPDDIQKMRLLKRLLEGSAKEMSAYYRDTSRDYYDLMQALAERYNRPDAVLNYLNRKLGGIARPRRETAKELRDFYNKIDAVCRQLRSSGCDTNHRLYLDVIMGKLPETLLSKVMDAQPITPPVDWNTDKVMGIIRGHVLKTEDIQRVTDAQFDGQQAQQQNKLYNDHSGARRVHATQKADPEVDDDNVSVTSEIPSVKSDGSMVRVIKKTIVNNFNYNNGPPKGSQWEPKGRVPPMGRHNCARPPPPGTQRCVFCGTIGKHRSSRCDKYPSRESRLDRLKAICRCAKCLRQDHTKISECPLRSKPCVKCGGKSHNPIFCTSPTDHSAHNKLDKTQALHKIHKKQDRPKNVMGLQQDQEQTESEVDASSEQEYWSSGQTDYGEDDDYQESHSFNNLTTADHLVMSASSNERTLLMTTELDVSNPQDPGQQCLCPVFFDQGSTSTLITKDLAHKLNLPILEEKIATFHGFGDSAEGKQVPCWTVVLVIHMRDNTKLEVTAEAVDTFTAPMTAVVSRKAIQRVINQPHLAPLTTVTTPQILIGSDYLNQFDLVRRKKSLANGFFVYDSRVGPMLNGRGKVSWKKGEQDRPQSNGVFRITVDPRQQALHKPNGEKQAQHVVKSHRCTTGPPLTVREIRSGLQQPFRRIDRIPDVGEFVVVADGINGAHYKLASVMEIPSDVGDGMLRKMRVQFLGGAVDERPMHKLGPFEPKPPDRTEHA